MKLPSNTTGTERPDFIARYFLRRLAMAHRKRPNRKPRIQYTNALVETILIFVGLPVIGLAGIVMISSLRWAPQILTKGPEISQLGLAIYSVDILCGHRAPLARAKTQKIQRRSVRLC
jgi:hypothetical protein